MGATTFHILQCTVPLLLGKVDAIHIMVCLRREFRSYSQTMTAIRRTCIGSYIIYGLARQK